MKIEEEEENEKMKIMEKEKEKSEALVEKEEERVGVGMEARERERGRDSVEQHPFTNLVFTTAPKNCAHVSHALYEIESAAKVQQTTFKSRSSLLISDLQFLLQNSFVDIHFTVKNLT